MNLQRTGSGKLIVAGEVRQHRKKRDQRNEHYYPGSFAFVWLAQNHGTANCNIASTSDGSVRSIETERGIVGAGETTAGSPQDSWADAGRPIEPHGGECERYVSSWWHIVQPGRKRHLELTMDGSDLERLWRDTNQRTSMVKTLDGVIGLGCFEPGQDGFNEDECKKSSDQWRHDLEMWLLWPNWIFDSMNGQVLS